jgi:hypothetical protein
MTQRTTREARVQLAGMLAIAAAGTAAYWIGQGATAFTGYAMSAVLAGWGLASAAVGEFNTTIGALSVVFAVTWIAACAWYARRG